MALDDGDRGVVVLSVRAGSNAQFNRIQRGDIIMSVSGEQIETVEDLVRVAEIPTRSWRIRLKRNGRLYTFNFRK